MSRFYPTTTLIALLIGAFALWSIGRIEFLHAFRVNTTKSIVKEFKGDFSVTAEKGKFDGVRISGSIASEVEFVRLVDKLQVASLSFNVVVELDVDSKMLRRTLFKKDP